jgi:hypothetical protein
MQYTAYRSEKNLRLEVTTASTSYTSVKYNMYTLYKVRLLILLYYYFK